MYKLCVLDFVVLIITFLLNKAEGLTTEEIINGQLAVEHTFKYVVAVMYNPQHKYLPDMNPCTGAIIGKMHVITVAHCFYDKELGGYLNKQFYVAFAITDLWNPSNSTQYIKVDMVIMPSSYDPNTPDTYSETGNIAIIQLASALRLHQGHRSLEKVKLAGIQRTKGNQPLTVASYGWNAIGYFTFEENGVIREIYGGASDGKLRFTHAQIVNLYTCEYEILGSIVAKGNMCAKIIQTLDQRMGICEGDSGAPLIRGKYLVGLAIHGFADCNDNIMPAIYVDITFYRKFITNVLANNFTHDMRILQLTQREPNVFRFEKIWNGN